MYSFVKCGNCDAITLNCGIKCLNCGWLCYFCLVDNYKYIDSDFIIMRGCSHCNYIF